MHIPDFSTVTYNAHPRDGFEYLSVGWLGDHVPSESDPEPALLELLRILRAANQLPDDSRGMHACELCPHTVDPVPWDLDLAVGTEAEQDLRTDSGKGEFFVTAGSVRYVLPNLVLHYMARHRYKLPSVVDAAVRLSAAARGDSGDGTGAT